MKIRNDKTIILKTINDLVSKDCTKFTGVYVDSKLDSQLTLLSISEGVSKSTLLRRMMVAFLSPRNLIQSVARRIYVLSQMKAEQWSDFDINMFKMYVQKELVTKGVDEETSTKIMDKVDNLLAE